LKIIAELEPLLVDLKKIGFDEFLFTNECTRLCNKLNILDVLTKAKNSHYQRKSDIFANLFQNNDALSDFLSDLYTAGNGIFFPCITELIISFLSWTSEYYSFDEIIKDLESIDIKGSEILKIKAAYDEYDKNLNKKINVIYNLIWSTIRSYPPDNGTYFKLRGQLMKSHLRDKLPPFIFDIDSLSACRSFLQSKGGYRQREDFLSEAFKPVLQFLNTTSFGQVKVQFDLNHVKEMWTKALHRIDADPQGAITAARSLLESVLKHILEIKGVEASDSFDLPKLYKIVAKTLNMAPDKESDTPINQALRGASMVVDGLAGIRNILGDSHGIKASSARPSPRHAELVVNISGALSNFLMRSLNEKHIK